jgi:hypothetical protein
LIERTPSWRTATLDHHFGIFFLGHAGHGTGGELEALAIGREQLGQEIDVPAFVDHRVVVAVEHGLLGGRGQVPFVEVGAFVGEEPLAVLFLHQAHRELVEVVALARPLRGEHAGAGDVVESGEVRVDVDPLFLLLGHCSDSSGLFHS